MKEIAGYYDGNSVQLLEAAPKTKQRVIVTFIEEDDVFDELPVGILSQYANPEKRHLEEGAFERAMVENMVMADANTMIRCIIGDDEQKIQELEKIREK